MADKTTKKDIQVGAIVLMAALLLIFGLLWLKQVRFSGGVISYVVDFEAVSGLQKEDRVNVRGIRMGAVDGFELHDGLVRVTFHVEDNADLRKDADIHLQTIGIVGEKIIDINPGGGEPADEGYYFQGVADADLTVLTAQASNSIQDAKEITTELKQLLANLREQGLVDSTLIAAKGAARTLESTTADLAPDLKDLISEMRRTTAAINNLVAGPDSTLALALADARSAAAQADTLTGRLNRAGESLAVVLARLENGEGTAGRILKDEMLYAQAESTITAVRDLIADVKARPKRYFHVSLF